MKLWILLAAAGSGYLARRWQNLQKSKEVSSGRSGDDGSYCGLSNLTLSSRRRYCYLSSFRRRLKASSSQNWFASEFCDSVWKTNDGCATHLYVAGEKTDEAQNVVILDPCSHSRKLIQFQTELDATSSYPTNAKNKTNISPRLHTLNACCEWKGFGSEFLHKDHEACGLVSAEAFLDILNCPMMNRYSAHCTDDNAIDGSGFMPRDESPVKPMYNVLDNDMASEEGAFPYSPWMPSYQNAVEDTSVFQTSSSFTMQEYNGTSNINTRKVRLHQKNGKRRCSKRRSRSLEDLLPITFSEICSSSRFDDECVEEEDSIHFSSACEKPLDGLVEHFGNEFVEAIVSDRPLSEENHGSLSSPRNENLRLLINRRKLESLVGEKAVESTHFPCLPLESTKREHAKTCTECSASPGGDSFLLQGTTNSLLKALLFNFGVGVGMMFTILSNKHGTKQLIKPLEGTLCYLKSLENEIHSRTRLMFECIQKKDTLEDVLTEQMDAWFVVFRAIFNVVEQVRNFLSHNLACISVMDHKHSKERARLEAELEVELERMEMNLTNGDVLELCRKYSGVSEDDLDINNLIQGELSMRGIPCEAEANLVSDYGGDSCYQVTHHANCGVPPVELAKRTCAVLESRQEREILDLEAEVKQLEGRLHGTQEELQVWKQRALHLLQGSTCASISSFPEKGSSAKAGKKTGKVWRAEEPWRFNARIHHSTLDSSVSLGCNEHITSNHTKEVCSLHPRGPQSRTCLSDEDDYEVSEEILKGFLKSVSAMPLCHQELKSTESLNDSIDDTLDSTPCVVNFVDGHTILHNHLEDKLDDKVGTDASSRKKHFNRDWNGEVVSKDVSAIQDKSTVCTQDVIEIFESYGQLRHTMDWSTPEDGSCSSDLEEQLGQLLIKRIVEKSRRGSLIVEAAQSVMASFDIDEAELSDVL